MDAASCCVTFVLTPQSIAPRSASLADWMPVTYLNAVHLIQTLMLVEEAAVETVQVWPIMTPWT